MNDPTACRLNPTPRTASMMNRIVASSLRQRLLVVLVTLVLIGAGTRSLNRLPVDAYPDLSPPMVEIITQWPGHAAEEVERLITVPIEVGDERHPEDDDLRSISLYGLSDVILTFEDGTDNYFARQQVFERIADLSLPTGVTPSVAPLFSPSGLIYRYVLQSSGPLADGAEDHRGLDHRAPIQVGARAWRTIRGLAAGPCNTRCCSIPAKIAGVGLSVLQVVTALAANNGNAGGGFYSQGGQFYYVRGLGRLDTLEDIGNVVLAVHDGTPVLVKDVGRVVIGIAPRLGEFGYEKQDDCRGRRHPDAHRREDPGCPEARGGEDPGAQHANPAQGRQGPPVLRPERFDCADDGDGRAKSAARHVAGRRGSDLLSLRCSRRA